MHGFISLLSTVSLCKENPNLFLVACTKKLLLSPTQLLPSPSTPTPREG